MKFFSKFRFIIILFLLFFFWMNVYANNFLKTTKKELIHFTTDKQMHYSIGSKAKDISKNIIINKGYEITLLLMIGISKEVYDYYSKRGTVSLVDIIYTSLPIFNLR